MAFIYIFAHQPEKAIELTRRALEMDHQFTRLHRMSMFAHLEAGRLDEAIKEAKSTPETEGPETIFQISIVCCAHAAAGQREKSLQMFEKLLAMSDQYSPALVQSAAICARLRDKDHAFELLDKALTARDERLLWIKVDPRFDNLHADERYNGLLRRMNLPK